MKVIKNYKVVGKFEEEFDLIKILDKQENVFADMPFVAVDIGAELKEPVIFGDYKGIKTVVEKETLSNLIKETEIHYFNIEDKKLIKTDKGNHEIWLRLPKGTNTDQLIIDNGQIVWAKPVEEE